jgi:hypothetical protein
MPLQDLEHGISATQSLEAENAEPLGFVLVKDLGSPARAASPERRRSGVGV